MRPICSDLLFKPVDYIFVTCLMKCMSWLVGVQSSPYSSNFICILILLLSLSSESVIEFWAMTWTLGLKSGTNPRFAGTGLRRKVPRRMHTHVVGVSGASWTHACPYQGSIQGFNGLKIQLVSRVGYLSIWDGS